MKKILSSLFIFLFILSSTYALDGQFKGEIPEYFSEFLDTNGNQTGTNNAIGNYATGELFYVQPPSGEVLRLNRMILTISDTQINNLDNYGDLTARTNGVSFWIENNGTRKRIDGSINIKSNGQYARLMYDFTCALSGQGSGNDYCSGRWTFGNSGTEIRLIGDTEDKLIVMLNDSYVGLLSHRFLVQGYYEINRTDTHLVALNDIITPIENIEVDTNMTYTSLLVITCFIVGLFLYIKAKEFSMLVVSSMLFLTSWFLSIGINNMLSLLMFGLAIMPIFKYLNGKEKGKSSYIS